MKRQCDDFTLNIKFGVILKDIPPYQVEFEKRLARSFLVLHSGLNGRNRYLFPRFYVSFMVKNILFQRGVILSIFVKV